MKVRIIKDKNFLNVLNIEIKTLFGWKEVAYTKEGLEKAIQIAQMKLDYPDVVWEGEK